MIYISSSVVHTVLSSRLQPNPPALPTNHQPFNRRCLPKILGGLHLVRGQVEDLAEPNS